ncbi:MAG: SH3 domain-containing protein [Bacillota bacterium]|nr:SH3 domain-containing protein [Bacillota bacterium]
MAGVLVMLPLLSACGSLFSTADQGMTLDILAQRIDQLEAEVSQLEAQLTALAAQAPAGEKPVQAGGGTLAVVTADVLNVRQAPSADSERVGVLMRGARVQVEKVEGDWTQVNFNNTLRGWVASQYLSADSGR